MNTMIPTEKTRPVFLIREYKVTDHKGKPKTFHTYLEQPKVSVIDATEGIFLVEGDRVYNRDLKYYKYTTDLKKYDSVTLFSHDRELLPFFADVTEDLPGQFDPLTYEQCQLMTEKRGGYLQFLHHGTGMTLVIAINSYTYTALQ